ncbi:MAG: DUF3850 domain-containing protein [archaeon]|jgi:hypothetical protein|nr:DUF3850 domain-containing protein [archaeon]
MKITKKCDSVFFDDILSGKKKFEVRLNDFECKPGDILILVEVDENRKLTGRKIEKKISYVLKTKDCKFWKKEDVDKLGFLVVSFED